MKLAMHQDDDEKELSTQNDIEMSQNQKQEFSILLNSKDGKLEDESMMQKKDYKELASGKEEKKDGTTLKVVLLVTLVFYQTLAL